MLYSKINLTPLQYLVAENYSLSSKCIPSLQGKLKACSALLLKDTFKRYAGDI